MAKINAEGVVSDATLSENPEPIEPDDLTPARESDEESEKVRATPVEETKPAKRAAPSGRKSNG